MLLRDGGNEDIEEDDVLTAFSPTISSTRFFTSSLNSLSVSSITVPANQRTKEIEEHSKRQFLDTVRDATKDATTVSGIKVRFMVYLDNQKITDTISQDYVHMEHMWTSHRRPTNEELNNSSTLLNSSKTLLQN